MGRKLQLDSAIAADIQTVNADSYIDSLKMIDIENIEPEPELVEKYERQYQKFAKIYPTVKDLFTELL